MTTERTHQLRETSVALLVLLWASGVQAVTSTWQCLGGNYSNAACWEPPIVPCGEAFDVNIPANKGTVNVDRYCGVNTFVLGDNTTVKVLADKIYGVIGQAHIDGIIWGNGGSFLAPEVLFPGCRARLWVDGGGTVEIWAPVYCATGLNADQTNYTLLSSDGAGSLLKLSAMTKLDDSVAIYGEQSHTIVAQNGGVIDLSGLQEIVGPKDDDWLYVQVNSGSRIDLRSLATVSWGGDRGAVQFNADGDATLALPSLTSVSSTEFVVSKGAKLNAAGTPFTYSATHLNRDLTDYTLLSSEGAGSRLNLAAMTKLDDSVAIQGEQSHTIIAQNGAAIDLSGLREIIGPKDDDSLNINVANGTIDMSSLQTVTGSTGKVSFKTDKGGMLLLGNVVAEIPVTIALSDPDDLLVGSSDLTLGANMTVSNPGKAMLGLKGDFTYSYEDEARLPFGKSHVFFDGDGPQELEVGGLDEGASVEKLAGDNFGFGQMIVGDPNKPAVVFLVDYVDNGNRAGSKPETLYLFGKSDPSDPKGVRMLDGLRLLGGSTLYMGGLKVYALRDGVMTDLSTLFGANQVTIPFDQGHLCLGRADVDDCRNIAAKGSVDQVIHTKPNTLYHVWFDVASDAAVGSEPGSILTVSAAGVSEQFPIDPPASTGAVRWQTKTWRFVAKKATTTLVFVATDAAGKPLTAPIANVIVMSPSAPYPTDCFALQDWSLVRDTGVDPNDQLTNDTDPNLLIVFTKPVWGTEDSIVIRGPDPSAGAVAKSVSGWNSNTLQVTFPTPLLKDGKYTVTLKSTLLDRLGEFLNGGAYDTVRSFTLDTVPPDVNVPSARLTKDPAPELVGTIDDPLATVQVTVAGKTYEAENDGKGGWKLPQGGITPPLPDGVHVVQVEAVDPAGNADRAEGRLTIDTTAPKPTADCPSKNDLSPELTGTIDDPQATVEVTVGAETYKAQNDGQGRWRLPAGQIALPAAGGAFEIEVVATDPAGNVGSIRVPCVLDRTPPTVSVNSSLANDATPALTGKVDDSDAQVKVTVGGKTYAATNNRDGTWTLPDNTIKPALADGVYNVVATATDLAGNAESASGTLTIDTKAPFPRVNQLCIFDASPELTGRVDDPQAVVRVTIMNKRMYPMVITVSGPYTAVNNGNGTWTLAKGKIKPGLEPGFYDVKVTATDQAGNVCEDWTKDELEICGS